MCTATWWRGSGGYELFFNRDELRARKEALPPRVQEGRAADGGRVRFLAPEDGDFGGTWISVNEAAVTLGLLNGYRAPDTTDPRDYRSRGLLVRDLAGSRSAAEVVGRLREVDVERYRSFRLLALDEGASAVVAEWDRRALEVDASAEGRRPLISSSFEESEVGRRRREEYARIAGDDPPPERLLAFQKSHANGPSAFSVCMHRPDAATRSFTHVRVGADGIVLRYHPGTPCEESHETEVRLPRGRSAA